MNQSYRNICRAFWADHIDDDPVSDAVLDAMSDALDATAQDCASFFLAHGTHPWLVSEEPNERLIKAAPKLLEAAKMLVALEDNEVHDADTRWKTTRNLLRAAIAQAEGTTT